MPGTFGAPTALPGQPGYKPRPLSEIMAKETSEMESRLSKLRTDLNAEAELRQAAGHSFGGGARWRSARADRGTVRSYAKDVKYRHQVQQRLRQQRLVGGWASIDTDLSKPHAGAGARAANGLREKQQGSAGAKGGRGDTTVIRAPVADGRADGAGRCPSGPGTQHIVARASSRERRKAWVKGKEVSQWAVADTLEWLDSLGLGQHKGVFEQNEISGPILLEVGLDDLDYMNILVLAHRKLILKGIEDIKRGNCLSNFPPPAPESSVVIETARSSTCTAVAVANVHEKMTLTPQPRPKSPPPTVVHWSHAKPLSEKKIESESSPLPLANLADGNYDEGKAHREFAEAVRAWRRGGDERKGFTTSPTSSNVEARSTHASGEQDLGGWEGETEPNDEVQQKHAENGMWTNPFGSPQISQQPTEIALELLQGHSPTPHPGKAGTVAVAAGAGVGAEEVVLLNEAVEHEAFKKAVEDWRGVGSARKDRGGGGDIPRAGEFPAAKGERGAENENDSCQATSMGHTHIPQRRAEVLAELIRKKMDEDHEVQSRGMERERLLLQEALEKKAGGWEGERLGEAGRQRSAAATAGAVAGGSSKVKEGEDFVLGGSSSAECVGDKSATVVGGAILSFGAHGSPGEASDDGGRLVGDRSPCLGVRDQGGPGGGAGTIERRGTAAEEVLRDNNSQVEVDVSMVASSTLVCSNRSPGSQSLWSRQSSQNSADLLSRSGSPCDGTGEAGTVVGIELVGSTLGPGRHVEDPRYLVEEEDDSEVEGIR